MKAGLTDVTRLGILLGRNDLRLIRRDSFLIAMLGFAALIALLLRYLLPALDTHLAAIGVMPGPGIPLRLGDLFPMIVAFMALYTGSALIGTVFGFLLLDERDQHTLTAMQVTPVVLDHYVLYRVCAPLMLAWPTVFCMVLIVNQAQVTLWQLLLLSAGASLAAPITALFYAAIAQNKVQGFGYAKFASIFGWIIVGGWFVDAPWQWLLGLFPPFLISKAYWLALDGSRLWWAALALGIVMQLLLIHWLTRWFHSVVFR